MKHKPVTEIGKRNKTASKKIDDNFMPENCDVIVTLYVIFSVSLESSGNRIPEA